MTNELISKRYSQSDVNKIEQAITLLVKSVNEYCRNDKPVILHSLRVGFKLMELDKPAEIVIAGILHDLVEDTHCTFEQIEAGFGPAVGKLVRALTMDYSLKDYKERWHNSTKRIINTGIDAVLIRVIDLRDNFPYYVKIITKERNREEWLDKNRIAIEAFKPIMSQHQLFQELAQMYNQAVKPL